MSSSYQSTKDDLKRHPASFKYKSKLGTIRVPDAENVLTDIKVEVIVKAYRQIIEQLNTK